MIPLRTLSRLALLAALLLLFDASAPEASAGLGGLFSGVSARGRIVQLCVVMAAFSLLIIMKKFSPDSRAFAPKVNYALSQKRLGDGDEVTSRGGPVASPVTPVTPVTEDEP